MPVRNSFSARKSLLALLALLLLAGDALAYAGPVPGPEFFGYFLSLLAWFGVAFGAMLLWPLHALSRRFRRGSQAPDTAEKDLASPEPAALGGGAATGGTPT
jgi:hypothetical protein